jgi:alkane 1-monooxygenase
MARVLTGIGLLGVFALLPLLWLELGVPWMTLAVSWIVVPVVDAWVGRNRGLSAPRARFAGARWVPRSHVLFQAVLLVAAVAAAPGLSAADLGLLALSVGTITGGIGITVAHELGHRAGRLDRALAKALLVTVAYGHFFVEHVRGHHVRVATPEDPASAPRGMNVYRFIVRSVAGGFVHAWALERMRLAARGLPDWHPSNWVLTGGVLSLALLAAATLAGGVAGLLVAAGQALWAIVLLEVVNYIEHYGLRRARRGDRYEPVDERFSWNADFAVSNWMLFNLQLHADHHARMDVPFEALRSIDGAPQLPAGYPAMVPVALVPPLWFALIDPRLPATAPAR